MELFVHSSSALLTTDIPRRLKHGWTGRAPAAVQNQARWSGVLSSCSPVASTDGKMLSYIARASRTKRARSSSDFGINRMTSPMCGSEIGYPVVLDDERHSNLDEKTTAVFATDRWQLWDKKLVNAEPAPIHLLALAKGRAKNLVCLVRFDPKASSASV